MHLIPISLAVPPFQDGQKWLLRVDDATGNAEIVGFQNHIFRTNKCGANAVDSGVLVFRYADDSQRRTAIETTLDRQIVDDGGLFRRYAKAAPITIFTSCVNDADSMNPLRIGQKVLTDSLRSMEADGIVTRTVYPEVPPRVEYAMTELGLSLHLQKLP